MTTAQLNTLFDYFLSISNKPIKKQGCFSWHKGYYIVFGPQQISIHVISVLGSKYVLKYDIETHQVSIVYK